MTVEGSCVSLQVIDVHSDSVEEEERNNTRTSSQKKLRAILMQLEGVAVLLIECEDRKRQLSAGTLPSELQYVYLTVI